MSLRSAKNFYEKYNIFKKDQRQRGMLRINYKYLVVFINNQYVNPLFCVVITGIF